MHKCTFLPILIFCAVISEVKTFHLPNLDLTSNVDVDSSKHNTGLFHSYLQSNWSQSLNIGSVSVGATIIIIFICVVMHLRVQERLNQISKHVQVNTRAISRLGSGGSKTKRQIKPPASLDTEEEV